MSQRSVDVVAIRTPQSGWFRFSILGLLITTTLIAAALAVTSWSVWDQDELWILRSWACAALALGILDRTRGKLGIVAATAGGGLVPAAVVLHLWQSPGRYPVAHAQWLSDLGHNAVLVTLAAGAVAAAAVAALCCLARWRPWWVVGLALLAAIGLVAIRPKVWMERSAIELTAAQNSRQSSIRLLALSSDGTHLAIAIGALTNDRLEIWSIDEEVRREGSNDNSGIIQRLEFSPDGTQLAMGSLVTQIVPLNPHTTVSRMVSQLALHDPRTAARQRVLQPTANVTALSQFRYAADGSALIALGSLPYHQAVLAWDAKTYEPLCQVAIPRPIPRILSGTGNSERVPNLQWAREQELAAERAWEPRTAADHRWLALGSELFDLGGPNQPAWLLDLSDRIVAQCDVWTVVAHRQPMPSHWLKRCPFVRRFYRHDELIQLKLVDLTSGRVILTSRWIREVNATAISHDGSTVAAVTADGMLRIWDVPE